MSGQVVEVQPLSRDPEEGQWSTGLCECYKDMGDCEYPSFHLPLHFLLIFHVIFRGEHDTEALILTTRGAKHSTVLPTNILLSMMDVVIFI